MKRRWGSALERQLYARMEPAELLTRLLSKRPLTFLNADDAYLLKGGQSSSGGFEAIGRASSAEEEGELRLADLISYDEMAISALLGMSVPTHFVNNGERLLLHPAAPPHPAALRTQLPLRDRAPLLLASQ